jgi:hypothetical protein
MDLGVLARAPALQQPTRAVPPVAGVNLLGDHPPPALAGQQRLPIDPHVDTGVEEVEHQPVDRLEILPDVGDEHPLAASLDRRLRLRVHHVGRARKH